MKKLLLIPIGLLFCFSNYAQLKVYSTGVTKIGSTRALPKMQRGLEISDTVLINSSLLFYQTSDLHAVIQKNALTTFSYPVIRGVIPNSLEIGTSSNYVAKVYASSFYSPNSLQITSDRRAKENISSISSSIERIKMLRPVYYDLKNVPQANMDTTTLKNKVGFIAQEVKEVFPQVVGYMKDIDLYTMDYTSLIPFLTKAIQEQQEQIETLQGQIQELNQAAQYAAPSSQSQTQPKVIGQEFSNASFSNEASSNVYGNTKLFQNTPNPFSQSTKIAYIVDEKATSAQICIYNLNGTQLKCYQIQPSSAGEIVIKGSELQAGMYIYAILVNGLLIDSKRMVLTN